MQNNFLYYLTALMLNMLHHFSWNFFNSRVYQLIRKKNGENYVCAVRKAGPSITVDR